MFTLIFQKGRQCSILLGHCPWQGLHILKWMCFSPCSVFLTDKNVCCQLWFEKEKTLCKLDQPLSTSESSPFSMGILFCSGLNPSSITPHCLFKTAPLLFLTAQRASLSIGWCPCDHHGYLREGAHYNGFEWWCLKYWATTQRFEWHADLPTRSSYGLMYCELWNSSKLILTVNPIYI